MNLLIASVITFVAFAFALFSAVYLAAATFIVVRFIWNVAKMTLNLALQLFKYLTSPDGFLILVGYLAALTLITASWMQQIQ
jgi:hypothetical protein